MSTAETPEEQEQEEASETQWPWGPAGRPSDRRASAGHLAQRPGEPVGEPGEPPPRHLNLLGAQKPNEPEREPPSSSRAIRATAAEADASGMREGGRTRVSLTPNLRWQVQQVQQHVGVEKDGENHRKRVLKTSERCKENAPCVLGCDDAVFGGKQLAP